MPNARMIGGLGLFLITGGAVLLWARPEPGGYDTQDLGASLFVLGSLILALALLAWDAMNPYSRRDLPGAIADADARDARDARRASSPRRAVSTRRR